MAHVLDSSHIVIRRDEISKHSGRQLEQVRLHKTRAGLPEWADVISLYGNNGTGAARNIPDLPSRNQTTDGLPGNHTQSDSRLNLPGRDTKAIDAMKTRDRNKLRKPHNTTGIASNLHPAAKLGTSEKRNDASHSQVKKITIPTSKKKRKKPQKTKNKPTLAKSGKDKKNSPVIKSGHKKGSKLKKEVEFASVEIKVNHSNDLYYNQSSPPMAFQTWQENEMKLCDGNFRGYLGEFAHIRNMIIDRKLCGNEKGGQKLSEVLNQPEEKEYLSMHLGCFQRTCDQKEEYFFNGDNHMNDWLTYWKHSDVLSDVYDEVWPQFTIVITRYEYANIYHTMTDWYNAFLMMNFFNKTQSETNILLIDAHPQGMLDSTWVMLFNSTTTLTSMKRRTMFADLVWGAIGYNSFITDHYAMTIPLVEEFRQFFMNSFSVSTSRKFDCDRLSILFLWRHDYLAHPRNPVGVISRKIKNEHQLLRTLQQRYLNYQVKGMQIDKLSMQDQLKVISHTDILIGMHGAGLTHTLFLPPTAGVIEFIPKYWNSADEHFMAMSGWRKLVYKRWTNTDPHNEYPNNYTRIPPTVLLGLVKAVVQQICDGDAGLPQSSAEIKLQQAPNVF